jgi:glucose dehydrogenase
MGKGIEELVTFLLIAAVVLVVCVLPVLVFVFMITLVSGNLKIFLLFFGPTLFIPGGLGVAAFRCLDREKPVAACLFAVLSLTTEVFAFFVIYQMR